MSGNPFSYQITATNNPTSYAASGLPTGLNVDSGTGLISGTPTVSGVFNATISATNTGGTGSAALTITVQQAPGITSAPPPAATFNTAYNFAYTFSGFPAPTFSVTSGALPTGLTLSSTGVISGTPVATGTYAGTVTATNGIGTPATQNFSITVLTTFNSWATQWFTPTQLADPTISGPNATPENDGVTNLTKYFFDVNPAEVMTPADIAALPAVGTTTNNGLLYLTLTYRENPLASGVSLQVQTSPDLQTWQPVTPTLPRRWAPTPSRETRLSKLASMSPAQPRSSSTSMSHPLE